MSKVYLAGPITGLTYGDSENWRDHVRPILAQEGIQGFSPLRRQEYLAKHGVLTSEEYPEDCMTTEEGIMVRDHWDVMRSDLVFAYLLGSKRVSIGTIMEFGFAYAHRKPVVVVMEKSGNVHDHAMLRQAAVFRAETLEGGIDLVKSLLLT